MDKRRLLFVVLLIAVAVAVALPETAMAQCAMCKASAESSLKEGGTAALGINTGVIYLASFPYLIFAVLGFLWYRRHRRQKLLEEQDALRRGNI